MGRLTDVLLAEVIRSSLGGDGQRELVALRDPQIGAALRLMHDRPEEGWTVERLASKVSMSRSAFANRFREVTGQPPMRYLTRHRLALAARLLRDGNASVWEVARRTRLPVGGRAEPGVQAGVRSIPGEVSKSQA